MDDTKAVVGIVVLGAALGLAYNAQGLRAEPGYGIPWIGEDRMAALDTLEVGEAPDPGAFTTAMNDPLGMGTATAAAPDIAPLDRPRKVALSAAKQLFDAGSAIFIDAREPEEFAEGHIPGALSMPYDEVTSEPDRMSFDTGGRALIVYCGGGACELSLNLAWDLIGFGGHDRVLVYEGGYPEWDEAGYPVEAE